MENKKYYLDFVITGAKRKELVQAISDYMEEDAKYLGAPSFAYQVGCFTIDRDGVVFFHSLHDIESLDDFLEVLTHKGFVAQLSNLGCEDEEVPAEEPCGEPAPTARHRRGMRWSFRCLHPASPRRLSTTSTASSLPRGGSSARHGNQFLRIGNK